MLCPNRWNVTIIIIFYYFFLLHQDLHGRCYVYIHIHIAIQDTRSSPPQERNKRNSTVRFSQPTVLPCPLLNTNQHQQRRHNNTSTPKPRPRMVHLRTHRLRLRPSRTRTNLRHTGYCPTHPFPSARYLLLCCHHTPTRLCDEYHRCG